MLVAHVAEHRAAAGATVGRAGDRGDVRDRWDAAAAESGTGEDDHPAAGGEPGIQARTRGTRRRGDVPEDHGARPIERGRVDGPGTALLETHGRRTTDRERALEEERLVAREVVGDDELDGQAVVGRECEVEAVVAREGIDVERDDARDRRRRRRHGIEDDGELAVGLERGAAGADLASAEREREPRRAWRGEVARHHARLHLQQQAVTVHQAARLDGADGRIGTRAVRDLHHAQRESLRKLEPRDAGETAALQIGHEHELRCAGRRRDERAARHAQCRTESCRARDRRRRAHDRLRRRLVARPWLRELRLLIEEHHAQLVVTGERGDQGARRILRRGPRALVAHAHGAVEQQHHAAHAHTGVRLRRAPEERP
jgi:hypothetical protein